VEVLSTSPIVRDFLRKKGVGTVRTFLRMTEGYWRNQWPTGFGSFKKVRLKIYKWGLNFDGEVGTSPAPAATQSHTLPLPAADRRRAELMAMATAFAVRPEYESLYDAASEAFRLHKIMEEKFLDEERKK
jgi:hypothetical protein